MSDRARDLLGRCVDVLQFYADPATYEVLHSTDPDVCDSTHCGCTSTPAHMDEGALAKEALSDIHAFLAEPERAGLSLERRVDVIEAAIRHRRFYEQAKATGLLEPASETPKDDDPCPSCCGSGCRCVCHAVGWRRPTLSP